MMRARAGMFRKRPSRVDDDDRVLPLINIVFLLLIFFMVVGRLSAADPFEIVPPTSTSTGEPPNEPLLIAIGPEGQLALNGELIEEAAMLERIGAAEEGEEIRIKSDGRVSAVTVVTLMERLRLAGVSSVRLMTVPSDQRASTGDAEVAQ
ncbi:MAG: biopolymer transporter ExbD [Pseudomonadota bacterium]